MLLLMFAMALTNAQQAKHDNDELRIYQRIQADKEAISDLWQPPARVVADYRKAKACYTNFHLYKVRNCDADLARVETDLGNIEVARSGER